MDEKAWIISADMGYGHQRTAYPLADFAFGGKIINANNYEGMPEKDRNFWKLTRGFYEFISNAKRIPLLGEYAFSLFDKFQKIKSFYPKKILSLPNFSVKKTFDFIEKGWGKDLILKLSKSPRPLITTFFIPAFMAETFNYPGEIFCVICDADISRAWVSKDPKKSRIKYLVPNNWVVERLKLYGVKEENVFLTGFPLPLENIGSQKSEILKEDLKNRLLNLDPEKIYQKQYSPLIERYIGSLPEKSNHILTLMFSIGGAGAQKEIVLKFLKSLFPKIKKGELKVILTAGARKNIKDYFEDKTKKLGLFENIEIIFSENIHSYFSLFNKKLRQTDILWTKPSELSFYVGLGIPIIIAPSIGSQEDFNKKWLLGLGAGILQENPDFSDQWIFDYLKSSRFAEAAMEGFIETEKSGTYNIIKKVFDRPVA